MIDALQRLFNGALAPSPDPADEAARLRLATCVMLLEAAHADSEFSSEEREAVTGLVRGRFDLDDAQTDALLATADAARRESGDLYRFARLLNESFPKPRKLAVVELLWEVVFSDGVLEAREDALMHKVGKLLGLRNDELMALKVRVQRRRGD